MIGPSSTRDPPRDVKLDQSLERVRLRDLEEDEALGVFL
jgi:hypothetical protein